MTSLTENWFVYFPSNASQPIDIGPGGKYCHFAVTISGENTSLYVDGQLVKTVQQNKVVSIGNVIKSILDTQSLKTESIDFPGTSQDTITKFVDSEVPRTGFHSYRFTPGRALYSGNSFTPPTSIIDLA